MASPLKPQMQCPNNLQFPDSRPRACSNRSLFVRRTPTRPRARGQEPYFTHRLVRSVRCGSKVRQRSALGELLGCDCETMGRNTLQRASDRLLRHRDTIETRLFQRAADLFDRTSTCCEGAADRQPLARRGHSREKRHDCPPLTLGLALDASGFARRSRVLAGNVAWLRERGHQCLVSSRERRRVFDESRAVAIGTAGGAGAGDGGAGRRAPRDGSADAARGPVAQGRDRRVEKVRQRIGRLQARHPSAAPHDAIDVQADDRGRNATAVAWKRQPLEGGGATHPGVHGLRTSSVGWDAERLWRTCVTRSGRAGRRPAGRRCAVAWRASGG